jgi:hypothetical protein
MRVVTGDAGERSVALLEAFGLAEIDRLVPDVPRDVPISINAFGTLRAVAFTAKNVEFLGAHSPRVCDRGDCLFSVTRESGGLMNGSFPVTRFTSDAGFMGLQSAGSVAGNRSGGMTFEAAGYSRNRVVGAVHAANSGS